MQFYNPKSRTVYTPNTNQSSRLNQSEVGPFGGVPTKEDRAKKYIQKMNGKMNGSKGSGLTRINKKEYAMVSHEIATNHPNLPAGYVGDFPIRNYMYKIVVANFGNYGIISKKKLK